MKLIENWREAWQFHSVQMAVLLIVFNGLVAFLPALEGVVSPWVYAALNAAGGIAVGILRVLQQTSVE